MWRKLLSGSSILSLLLTPITGWAEEYRIIPHRTDLPYYVDGPFVLDRTEASNLWGGLTPSQYGSTEITVRGPGGVTLKSYKIRDQHYDLGDGRIGVRYFPFWERMGEGPDFEQNYPEGAVEPVKGGKEVSGSQLVDDYFFAQMGGRYANCGPDSNKNDPYECPVFMILTNSHPEQYSLDFTEIGEPSKKKIQMTYTHTGAYIGRGQTRNSPFWYHDMQWQNHHEPTLVTAVTMKDTDKFTLNLNALVTLRLLNEGREVVFSEEPYKFDYFHAINLKESLAHLRAWIDPEYIRSVKEITGYGLRGQGRRTERRPSEQQLPPEHQLDTMSADYDPTDQLYHYERILHELGVTSQELMDASTAELQAQADLLSSDADKGRVVEYVRELKKAKDETGLTLESIKEINNTSFQDFLRNNKYFLTYCAEHINIVLNVMLNLPQNLNGYVDMFGPMIGTDLFAKAQEVFERATGNPMPTVDDFVPLWKKPAWVRGESQPQPTAKPYYKANLVNQAGEGIGSSALAGTNAGKAMIWDPATNADLIAQFMRVYAPWYKLQGSSPKTYGTAWSAAALFGFTKETETRAGLNFMDFAELAAPVIAKMAKWELVSLVPSQINPNLVGSTPEETAQLEAAELEAKKAVFEGEWGGMQQMLAATLAKLPPAEFQKLIMDIDKEIRLPATQDAILAKSGEGFKDDISKLYWLYQQDLATQLAIARRTQVTNPWKQSLARYLSGDPKSKNVGYYSPPDLAVKVDLGVHDSNEYVTVKTYGTVISADLVEYKDDGRVATVYNLADPNDAGTPLDAAALAALSPSEEGTSAEDAAADEGIEDSANDSGASDEDASDVSDEGAASGDASSEGGAQSADEEDEDEERVVGGGDGKGRGN